VDEGEWLRGRGYLKAHRYELGVAAADQYPAGLTLAGTPLLASQGWRPTRPVPLNEIACEFHPDASRRPTLPAGPVPDGYASYAEAVAALDRPTVFEDRPTFRLLDADLTGLRPTLAFGTGSYFDGPNTGEAAAHELTGPDRTLRRAIGDPTDLTRRPANLAISALTLRNDGGDLTFPLHWRDPAKVGHAGGLYMVVPVGIFQPPASDLWGAMLREFAEELGGYPEHYERPVDPVFADAMSHTKAWVFGLGADPLTFATDLLTAVVIDAPLYDELFGAATHNDEGTVTQFHTFDNVPAAIQAAGAATTVLAERHARLLAPC
jgi:8-oxo-dGTP pyrophosphatase MutT (NUDIX family)